MPEFASKTRIVIIVTESLEYMLVCDISLARVSLHVPSQLTASQDGNPRSRRMQVQGGIFYRSATVVFTFFVSACSCLPLVLSI